VVAPSSVAKVSNAIPAADKTTNTSVLNCQKREPLLRPLSPVFTSDRKGKREGVGELDIDPEALFPLILTPTLPT